MTVLAVIRDWKSRWPARFELVLAIVLGVLIEAALVLFQPPVLSIVRRVADDTADKMIRLAEGTTDALPGSPAFVLVDIDDASWTAMGAPNIVPRAKVLDLLRHAAASRPMMTILDIDLSFQGDPDEEKALAAYLAAYPTTAPPLLLVRPLIGAGRADGPALPRPRATGYEAATDGKANIAFASPLFLRDPDGKIRRWRLYVEACADGLPVIVQSTHLAAAAIARDRLGEPSIRLPSTSAGSPIADLKKSLGPLVPRNCTSRPDTIETVLSSQPGLPDITVSGDDVTKRVIYRVAWRDGAVGLGPVVESSLTGKTQLVAIRPAQAVLALPPGAPIPGIENRIVVIGGSFADSGDWHDTPLGKMPGALVLINAAEALTINGTPREPALGERIGISLVFILIISLITSIFRPSVAAWASAGMVLGLMLVTLGRFKSGVMLDLAVPAVGAFLHDFGASLVATWTQFRAQGLGWFLRRYDHAVPKKGEGP